MAKCLRLPLIFLAGWLLAACEGWQEFSTDQTIEKAYFLPPTAIATNLATPIPFSYTPTPPSQQTGEVFRPTPTPACEDHLRFIEDITVPDGSRIKPQETIDKRWRVENNGTCNWNERYRLRLVGGPELGAPTEQALYPARSNTQAVIRIQFISPAESGKYRSAWQAFNDQGSPFGDPIFIDIVVR